MKEVLNRRKFAQKIFDRPLKDRPVSGMRSSTGLDPYTGPWTELQVKHLLKRATYGAKRSSINQLINLSPQAAVDLLLYSAGTPHTEPIHNYSSILEEPDPDIMPGEVWVNAPYTENGNLAYSRLASMKAWWIHRMIQQPLSIEEKMIVFWHNHFGTRASDIFEARIWYRHWMKLKEGTFSSLRSLVETITKDPQMLIFLNGQFNEVGAPDENYGRELLELFTLGAGSGYTEDDVQAAASILTGLKINYETLTYYFDPSKHDSNDKQFSPFFDNEIINGITGIGGENEISSLLDMIFAKDECALFIIRKIYRYFVYHQITEEVETNIIQPLASLYRNSNYEILPVLDMLFKSEHFFDPLNIGAVLKSPLDFMIGMLREFEVAIDLDFASDAHFSTGVSLWYILSSLQQDPGDPPNVAGWPAYYQVPQYDKKWINTDTLPRRGSYSESLSSYGLYASDTVRMQIDMLNFYQSIPLVGQPLQLIEQLTDWLFQIPVSDELKYLLRAVLLSNQVSDYYWTNAWFDYVNFPDNQAYYYTVYNRLSPFMKIMLQAEEYQLM